MAYVEPGFNSAAPCGQQVQMDSGLTGILAAIESLIYRAAPRKNRTVATAGALSIFAGIVGNSYNISKEGVNLYLMLGVESGGGKNIVSRINNVLQNKLWLTMPHKPGEAYPFQGPGDIMSAAGYLGWLVKHPCHLAIVAEGGKKMRSFLNPRDPNGQGIKRLLTDLWSRSGADMSIAPRAYADATKGSETIRSPASTLLFEGVMDDFAQCLTPEHIRDGFFTRIIPQISDEPLGYIDPGAMNVEPSRELIEELASIGTHANSIYNSNNVQNVTVNLEAQAIFTRFDRHLVDTSNNVSSGLFVKELYNRVHLNSMKLAALAAISDNYLFPQINERHANWATHFVLDSMNKLIDLIASGNVGEEEGNEARQQAKIIQVIKDYLSQPYDANKSKNQKPMMHKAQIVTHNFVYWRCQTLPSFKPRAADAVNRVMKTLLDADDVRLIGRQQMQDTYGTAPKAYMVHRHKTFDLEPLFFTSD